MNGLSLPIISSPTREKIRSSFLGAITSVAHPTVYAMAGIPGAGKSTFVRQAIKSSLFPQNAFILNPDLVMEALPEYHHDCQNLGYEQAFSRWEMPARTLAYDLFQDAVNQRVHIIKDMGSAREENYQMLVQLKEQGYRLVMHYLACSPEEALRRIRTRPRHTPEALVYERHKALEELMPRYRALVDEFYMPMPAVREENAAAA